jgi:tetratricopeptide (TPR) repeat protein
VLSLQEENGEVWSALGHCYLMQDDLQKAYSAYQQALYLLPNPKVCINTFEKWCWSLMLLQEDPKLWYGIGILYDRYGSLDHAEEAFSSVLRMDKGTLHTTRATELRLQPSQSSVWTLTRPTRSCSVSASFTSNRENTKNH